MKKELHMYSSLTDVQGIHLFLLSLTKEESYPAAVYDRIHLYTSTEMYAFTYISYRLGKGSSLCE